MMHGRTWGIPVRGIVRKYEKLRPPRAVCLALQGSVRAIGRLRGDGGRRSEERRVGKECV